MDFTVYIHKSVEILFKTKLIITYRRCYSYRPAVTFSTGVTILFFRMGTIEVLKSASGKNPCDRIHENNNDK